MSEDGNQGGLFAFERAVLPTTGAALAAWFSQAVRAEIAALERDARRRRVELLSAVGRKFEHVFLALTRRLRPRASAPAWPSAGAGRLG